ncbi:unnamed protein product [Plutella xylostella]|uniref:(diamondback moth) hypothetical protein n=1 Tax=Plutella xylostella TaxID=51655 RepID=A0A8S4EY22_PLUXY|nr:unnamed protein product [Plutella xylostella]
MSALCLSLGGLDVVSIRHLVVLLRLLSRQGRTIVCTIHQPSASLFALFDRVYVVARGLCCYQGAAPLLVPFLSEVGRECPTTHNPADFVLESLQGDPEAAAQMSELCQNGKLCRKLDRITARGGRRPVLHSDESIQRIFTEHVAKEQFLKMEFPTTFLTQFSILSKRMFVQTTRNSIGETKSRDAIENNPSTFIHKEGEGHRSSVITHYWRVKLTHEDPHQGRRVDAQEHLSVKTQLSYKPGRAPSAE